MSIAYVALGSNLGDKEGNLREALRRMEEQGIKAARRTVNKYRTKMGIGDKSARKKWE